MQILTWTQHFPAFCPAPFSIHTLAPEHHTRFRLRLDGWFCDLAGRKHETSFFVPTILAELLAAILQIPFAHHPPHQELLRQPCWQYLNPTHLCTNEECKPIFVFVLWRFGYCFHFSVSPPYWSANGTEPKYRNNASDIHANMRNDISDINDCKSKRHRFHGDFCDTWWWPSWSQLGNTSRHLLTYPSAVLIKMYHVTFVRSDFWTKPRLNAWTRMCMCILPFTGANRHKQGMPRRNRRNHRLADQKPQLSFRNWMPPGIGILVVPISFERLG